MNIFIFMCLLVVIGCWNMFDAWVSIAMYIRNKEQTWYLDHYIRIIRGLFGLLAWYLAYAMIPGGI